MRKLLKLGRYNQVSGISVYNTKGLPPVGDQIDITDVQVPEDINLNPQNWTFEDGAFREFTDEEKSERDFPDEVYWNKLRNDRTELLSSSDWTQVPDAPVDRQAWATYRQALRDLPDNTTDPRNPVWPVKPT